MKARSFWPLAIGYVALRILLTVVIAVVVVLVAQLAGLDMPVLVAAMLAVIVQLPLAWLVLGGMRRRLTAQVASSAGERRRLRGELQAALSGEQGRSDEQPDDSEQSDEQSDDSTKVHDESRWPERIPEVRAPSPAAGATPDEVGRP